MPQEVRIVTDLHGRIVGASPEAGKLFAIEDRWLLGKPLAAFVADDHRRAFRNLLLALSRGASPGGLSLAVRRRDGTDVSVDVEAVEEVERERLEWVLARGPDADVQMVPEGLGPDKTLPYARLLARLPVGVISLDRRLMVEYLNPAARMFVEGAVGSLLPEPWPAFSLRKFAARLFGGSPPVLQVVETPQGRLLELDGIAPARSGHALLLLQDVTAHERRRLAEQEFVGNAAHELRTPVAAIASALDVLQGGAKENAADRDLFLDHIERETERLARLMAALLQLAKMQTGQQIPSLQLVEVGPLLEELLVELDPRPGVEVRVACEGNVRALADPELLRQAVWNVATNAVRHTRSGEIVAACRDLGALAEVEITDTGSGIAPEHQERIFDRFYRAERLSDGGFGLGLPIAAEIASVLGGSLTLHSEPGAGTRVRLRIPSARVVQS